MITAIMRILTENQEKALLLIGYGVRSYGRGFFSEDDPNVRLDLRSAGALCRRGLAEWRTAGGITGYVRLDLTNKGWELFEEIQDR